MAAMNPVGWFEIYVENMERAKRFYEQVLDVQMAEIPMPTTPEENMAMVGFPMNEKGSGASGALVRMNGFQAGGNSTLVYFSSMDCGVEESRIEAAGGKVITPKQSLGEHGFMVLALDSEGNMFGIHSQA